MKMRFSFWALVASTALTSCTTDLMHYEGANMVRFSGDVEVVYSFAYYSESKTEDVINVNVMTVGEVVDYPRTVRFEQQKKEWKYTYDPQDANKVIDSTYVDMESPAEEGRHFQIQNAEGNQFVVPAGANSYVLKILLKRSDEGLKKNARKLHLRLVPDKDFGIMSDVASLKKITISDKLEKPRRWRGYYCDYYLGNWSEVKHRFMINVTGQKWDNDFILHYVNGRDGAALCDFYLSKIKKALEEYNANPSNNPPLKDENGKEVVFP